MDDKEIICLFFSRSETAIAAVSDTYGKLIRSVIRAFLNNEDDISECEQDVYMAVWKSIPPDRPDSLPSYLTRIARNKAVSLYRYENREKRASYLKSTSDLETLFGGSPPDEILAGEELAAAVNTFLKNADKTDRIIFIRHFYFGQQLKQIAADNGLSYGSVKTRLSRLKKELQSYLKRKGLV